MIKKRSKSWISGHRIRIRLLKAWVKIINIDLLSFAHSEMGVGNSGNEEISGEKYLIGEVLKKYFSGIGKYIFFDVGANIGEYSKMLRQSFKDAEIFSFEPNPKAYDVLKNLAEKENFTAENIGIGEKIGNQVLYSFKKLSATQLGTTNKEILKNYQINEETEEINFFSDTIDNYCTAKKIQKIDFIKIDVEGSELFVLKGSEQLLKKDKIKIIQFEFNEPNVANRIFLKDFYNILPNFDFYRIKKGGLIPLDGYDAKNEIFRYQNILAINKSFSQNHV